MTGIISDCYAFSLSSLLDNIICKSLGRSAYYIDVHTVNTCTDNSAQARCSKFQIFVEAFLFQFLLCVKRAVSTVQFAGFLGFLFRYPTFIVILPAGSVLPPSL